MRSHLENEKKKKLEKNTHLTGQLISVKPGLVSIVVVRSTVK